MCYCGLMFLRSGHVLFHSLCVRNWCLTFVAVFEQSRQFLYDCGVGDLPNVGSLAQKEFLHLCCIHLLPWCAGSPGAVFIVDVHLTMFRLSASFSDTLQSHYAVTHHTTLSLGT